MGEAVVPREAEGGCLVVEEVRHWVKADCLVAEEVGRLERADCLAGEVDRLASLKADQGVVGPASNARRDLAAREVVLDSAPEKSCLPAAYLDGIACC